MDSINRHNQALQQNGYFSAEDLEANREKRYSPSQLKRIQNERSFVGHSTRKYQQKPSPSLSILAVGLLLIAVALDFNGNLEVLDEILGDLFLPIMLGALFLALFFILVIIPRQYQDSAEAYHSMLTSLADVPPGAIQVIEARAELYSSDGKQDQRDGQSPQVSHILQMEGINIPISKLLYDVIQPKRSYRVYFVHGRGTWVLLSMETTEESYADEFSDGTGMRKSGVFRISESHKRS